MKKKIGEACLDEKDCYNKNCVSGVCTKKTRKRRKKIGEDCLKDAACYSRKCYRTNELQNTGKCIGKSKRNKIGLPCREPKDCYNKNCVNGVCSRKKRVYKKLGEDCVDYKECYSRNCMNGVCTTKKKRHISKTQKTRTRPRLERSKTVNTPTRVKTPSPVNAPTRAKTQTPPKSQSPVNAPTPPKSPSPLKSPTPVNASTPTPVKTPTPASIKKKYTLTPKDRIVRYSPASKQITPPNSLRVNEFFEIPSNKELLKMHEDMKAIGINQAEFYYDPCYFLNGLNKLIGKSNFKKYENKMYLLLPIIYPKNENFRENHYKKNNMIESDFLKQIRASDLGGNHLDICFEDDCYIADGSFGEVYTSKMNKKEIVIKSPITKSFNNKNEKHNEVFDENLIQSVLYCALRGQTNNMAKIPKIEYMARLYMPNSQMKIITGLERLDGDMNTFIETVISNASPSEADILLKDMMIQICKLLEVLQDRYNFHHRDLHAGNIMYKNIGTPVKPVYRWYLIDFGYAYLEKDGKKYHSEAIGIYPKYTKPNFAHDFRIFFTYFAINLKYYMLPNALISKSKIINLMINVSENLFVIFSKYTRRFHWHDSYVLFDYELPTDNYTNPRSLRKMLEDNNF